MKLIRLIFVSVILLLIFKTNLVSQFHVESKVEFYIDIEDGYPDIPTRIVLFGSGINRKIIYSLDLALNRNGNHAIYNVSPGKYRLSFESNSRGVLSEIHYVTLYNPEKEAFHYETIVRNEIEVHPNRNLKIELLFKYQDEIYGFNRVLEKRFNDFDYIKFIYYTSPSSFSNFSQLYQFEDNNLLIASNEMDLSHGPFTQGGSVPTSANECDDICGDKPGKGVITEDNTPVNTGAISTAKLDI